MLGQIQGIKYFALKTEIMLIQTKLYDYNLIDSKKIQKNPN